MNWALTPSRVEAGFWLIILVGLTAGVGLETDWGRHMQRTATQTAETPPVFAKPALAEPFHLADPDQFLDITLRPLFIVTRRPAPIAPPPQPPKPTMVKAQFILMGTTIVAEGRFAFMLEKAGNKSRVVAEGKEINGIMVKEITAERVVLSQYDDTEVLMLKTNKPPPGAPRPVVAPGAAPPTAFPSGMVPIPSGMRSPNAPPQPAQPQLQPQPQPQPQPRSTIGPR